MLEQPSMRQKRAMRNLGFAEWVHILLLSHSRILIEQCLQSPKYTSGILGIGWLYDFMDPSGGQPFRLEQHQGLLQSNSIAFGALESKQKQYSSCDFDCDYTVHEHLIHYTRVCSLPHMQCLTKRPKEPTMVKIKIKQPNDKVVPMDLPVILPHMILEYLLDCGLTLSDQLVSSFWRHLESVNDEWAVSTAAFRATCDSHVWPLGLWGDDACMMLQNAPYDKIHGVFLNIPLCRPKTTRLTRYLLFTLENAKLVDYPSTVYPAMEAVVASLNLLTEVGVKGRRFLLGEIRGDQAWLRLLFRHKAMWTANQVCFKCKARADDSHLSYTNYCSANSGWRATLRTTEEFIQQELQEPLCHLVDVTYCACMHA